MGFKCNFETSLVRRLVRWRKSCTSGSIICGWNPIENIRAGSWEMMKTANSIIFVFWFSCSEILKNVLKVYHSMVNFLWLDVFRFRCQRYVFSEPLSIILFLLSCCIILYLLLSCSCNMDCKQNFICLDMYWIYIQSSFLQRVKYF